jgi:hypothetical protein
MTQVERSAFLTKTIFAGIFQRLITAAGLTLAISCLTGLGAQLPTAWANPTASAGPSHPTLADGTYLFGQAQTRDQLGAAYLVFEVIEAQTVGAFYMPSSSFDCFYGAVEPAQINLTIVDSYEQTTSPYAISLTVSDSLVAGNATGTLGLVGFHQIAQITDQDLAILNTCQINYPQQI